MTMAKWHRQWCDVGMEDEPLTEEEREAAEEEARQAVAEEFDALYARPATTAGEEGAQAERADAETVEAAY